MTMIHKYRYFYKGSVNILIHDPIHNKRMIYVNKLSNNLLEIGHSSALFSSSAKSTLGSNLSPVKGGVATGDYRGPS